MSGATKLGRAQVVAPVADLLNRPGGARQRQLLFGDQVDVLDREEGYASVLALKDGYGGYIRRDQLGPVAVPTHRVQALATHLYERPDFKSPDVAGLSFGSQLCIEAVEGAFSRLREGVWVPSVHIAKLHRTFRDPAGVAELFLGTPYLWGGNSRLGLDCSGLVQTALLACGVECPGDSGDQESAVGQKVADDQPLVRGDLLFWKGHVAMAVDAERLIHATAFRMATIYEPAADAARRILSQGGGAMTSRRRLTLPE
ncbi:MAG: NlpC/P60 family protein [Qingshengfaniella sp.]